MITVGASITYRVFKAYVQLSNGQRLKGTRLSKPMSEGKFYPLIDAADAISANTSVEEGDPKGYLVPSYTQLGTKHAPFIASFSSKGPNVVTPEILKPDISAPGVIAAYSKGTSPTGLELDNQRTAFNSEFGTSMSCPHVTGLVGLLKTLYPHWRQLQSDLQS